MGRPGARIGDYAHPTGGSWPWLGVWHATAGVWSSREWAEEEDVGPEGAAGAVLGNPSSWALDEAPGGSTPGILGFGWGL